MDEMTDATMPGGSELDWSAWRPNERKCLECNTETLVLDPYRNEWICSICGLIAKDQISFKRKSTQTR
ncbi:MAG: TFIIB-type zinc ribbon-containing protein [Candidatus Hodarchaeota archaeon]